MRRVSLLGVGLCAILAAVDAHGREAQHPVQPAKLDVTQTSPSFQVVNAAVLAPPDEASTKSDTSVQPTTAHTAWKNRVAVALNVKGHNSTAAAGDKLKIVKNGELVGVTEVPQPVQNLVESFHVNVNEPPGAFRPESKCPLSADMDAPFPQKLTVCTEFKSSACCSADEEKAVERALKEEYEVVYGACPGCVDNFRQLLCNVHCSPQQHRYVNPRDDGRGGTGAAVTICQPFCDSLYGSCRNTTLGAQYHSEHSFCLPQLNTLSGIFIELGTAESESAPCMAITAGNSCTPMTPEEQESAMAAAAKGKGTSPDGDWSNMGALVATILLVAIVLLLILAFLYWRRVEAAAGKTKCRRFDDFERYFLITGAPSAAVGEGAGNGYYGPVAPGTGLDQPIWRQDPDDRKAAAVDEVGQFSFRRQSTFDVPAGVPMKGPCDITMTIATAQGRDAEDVNMRKLSQMPPGKLYCELHVGSNAGSEAKSDLPPATLLSSRQRWVTRYRKTNNAGVVCFNDSLRFEVKDVELSEAQIVIRDWTDKNARHSKFRAMRRYLDKELIGLTDEFALLGDDGDVRGGGFAFDQSIYEYGEIPEENASGESLKGRTVTVKLQAVNVGPNITCKHGNDSPVVWYAQNKTSVYPAGLWRNLRPSPGREAKATGRGQQVAVQVTDCLRLCEVTMEVEHGKPVKAALMLHVDRCGQQGFGIVLRRSMQSAERLPVSLMLLAPPELRRQHKKLLGNVTLCCVDDADKLDTEGGMRRTESSFAIRDQHGTTSKFFVSLKTSDDPRDGGMHVKLTRWKDKLTEARTLASLRLDHDGMVKTGKQYLQYFGGSPTEPVQKVAPKLETAVDNAQTVVPTDSDINASTQGVATAISNADDTEADHGTTSK